MSTAVDSDPTPPQPPADPYEGQAVIVARAGGYYRKARYVMALICLGMGGWFAYDGWVAWPGENAAAVQRGEEKMPRSDLEIRLQRRLAVGLPALGAGVVAWMLYRSRGQYRLDGDTLHAPGHPPVPLAAVREIDKTLWDRKGIARIEYDDPAGGAPRRLTLDDFVYDQKPTDAILARVEKALGVSPEEAGAEREPG